MWAREWVWWAGVVLGPCLRSWPVGEAGAAGPPPCNWASQSGPPRQLVSRRFIPRQQLGSAPPTVLLNVHRLKRGTATVLALQLRPQALGKPLGGARLGAYGRGGPVPPAGQDMGQQVAAEVMAAAF